MLAMKNYSLFPSSIFKADPVDASSIYFIASDFPIRFALGINVTSVFLIGFRCTLIIIF